MLRFQALLMHEVCCLSLLLLQAQTHGAPATTPNCRVQDHNEFLPLFEDSTTAGRQLSNADQATTTTASLAVGGTNFSKEKNFTETNGYKTEQTAALEKMYQKEFSDSTPHEATFTNEIKYSKVDSAAEEKQGGSNECTISRTEGAAAMPVVISPDDCDVLGLNKDGTDLLELDFEWDVPESFSAERCASLKNEKEKREMARLPYFSQWTGCRSVDEYEFLNSVKEGSYGVVYRAREKRTGEVVALKRLKSERCKAGVPITAFPEIGMLLKAGDHPNIVNLQEVAVSPKTGKIYLVMEFVDRDLKQAIDTVLFCNGRFTIGEVKNLLRQLLSGVAYLHDNWILHRDLKPQNLLLTNAGILKIGDFGLSREYGDPLKPYSPHVITLWYRPPELLLGAEKYSTAVDMWSCGCILAELLKMRALFPGDDQFNQIIRIFADLGTPNETIWPGFNSLPVSNEAKFEEHAPGGLEKKFSTSVVGKKGLELLKKLLTYDPAMRLSARDALNHEWFLHFPAPRFVYILEYEQRCQEKRKSKTQFIRMLEAEIDETLKGLQIEPKKEKAGPSSAMQLD